VSTGGVSCQQADYRLECRVNSFEQTKWTFVLRLMVEETLDEIESRKIIFSIVKTLNGRNNSCPKTMTLVCTNFEVRNISCKQLIPSIPNVPRDENLRSYSFLTTYSDS